MTLAQRVNEVARVSGTFTLRSGQTSDTYFDKYLFEADPALLAEVVMEMFQMVPRGTEVLAGLELGGVPLVTVLSSLSGLPAAFVRKEAKAYGTAQLAEGASIFGKNVVVIEDVITTGGQVLKSVRELRERGAVIDHVLCVIDRSPTSVIGSLDNLTVRQTFENNGLTLASLFTMAELDAA